MTNYVIELPPCKHCGYDGDDEIELITSISGHPAGAIGVVNCRCAMCQANTVVRYIEQPSADDMISIQRIGKQS